MRLIIFNGKVSSASLVCADANSDTKDREADAAARNRFKFVYGQFSGYVVQIGHCESPDFDEGTIPSCTVGRSDMMSRSVPFIGCVMSLTLGGLGSGPTKAVSQSPGLTTARSALLSVAWLVQFYFADLAQNKARLPLAIPSSRFAFSTRSFALGNLSVTA
jgi:hypothetical protein